MRHAFFLAAFFLALTQFDLAEAASCRLDIKLVNKTGKTMSVIQRENSKYDSSILVKGGSWHLIWIASPPGSTKAIKKNGTYHFIYQTATSCDQFRRFRFGYRCGDGNPKLKYFPGTSGWFPKGKKTFRFLFEEAACS